MIFCTVHAGKNRLTNITIKSILKFHPTAKIFVVDVTNPETSLKEGFNLLFDTNNVETISGISRKDILVQPIDIESKLTDKKTIQFCLSQNIDLKQVNVIKDGDIHHTMNIQFAIDKIDQNFILIDNDAPLRKPVDFSDCDVCVSDMKLQMSGDYYLSVFPIQCDYVYRFIPFIQYMNIKQMKKFGIQYCSWNLFQDNAELSWLFHKNWGSGLHFPTGSIMFKEMMSRECQFNKIAYREYVDHFGHATWQEQHEKLERFIQKYEIEFNLQMERGV